MITPEIAKEWYSDADTVHDFEHIMRVYRMAQYLSLHEGANLEIVLTAALLHDAGGNGFDSTIARKEHHLRSAEFAGSVLKVYNYAPDQIEQIQHCIRSHRFRSMEEKPNSIEAKILFDADKLDSIGAIGIARAIAYAVGSGKPIFYPPSEQFLITGITLPEEPHSAYHEYIYKLCKIKDRLFTDSGKLIAEERHQFMSAYFEKLRFEWSRE